jgi:hypothetical protein
MKNRMATEFTWISSSYKLRMEFMKGACHVWSRGHPAIDALASPRAMGDLALDR